MKIDRALVPFFLVLAVAAAFPVLAGDPVPASGGRDGTGGFVRWTQRQMWDRPVLGFTRGPAALLLLEPGEVVEYESLATEHQRRMFIEKFWFEAARNCPEGSNPVRDQFWERVEEALRAYEGEGVPGWATVRGRFRVLLGAPEKVVPARVKRNEIEEPAEVWAWAKGTAGDIRTLAFFRDDFRWVFAGRNVPVPEQEGELLDLSPEDPAPLLASLGRAFRARGCELTPEQRAELAKVAWRRFLWQACEKVLAGEKPGENAGWKSRIYYFPAAGEGTFALVTFFMDERPPEGTRLVALLRPEEGTPDEARALGTEEFPFEVRRVGGTWVAQAARTLPPGRYALAGGWTDADGNSHLGFAGEQIVARMGGETFRLSSVVLAAKVDRAAQGEPFGPFRVSGMEVVPRPGDVLHRGEDLAIFYEVLGAGTKDDGSLDLSITYEIRYRHPKRGWVRAGRQALRKTRPVQAWFLKIADVYPLTDYRVVVTVKDNVGGGTVTKEVPFRVAGK